MVNIDLIKYDIQSTIKSNLAVALEIQVNQQSI